ncbi:hypothetical protein [Winogradskya humida]|uniref:Uncharacterized protein n=1 Tax=Winogradskya humida TaxID=113566 RepID=A0ABQ3ZQ30_9ACTN|nr:hypothetical protein [Actinoplanes humidus]GIE20689.1 hypothetical protein Ahu01nite_037910 [Actinoplanes humidus]
MAYLFPPMNDEPPPDYREFVAARLDLLELQAARLTGGDHTAARSLTVDTLTDLAGHWRRLHWKSRLQGRDARVDYLQRRLAIRTRHWREEQLYPVEVTAYQRTYKAIAGVSVAQRLALLIPSTVREELGVVAEAEIAWLHAYRHFIWRRYARVAATSLLLFIAMVQFFIQASAGS